MRNLFIVLVFKVILTVSVSAQVGEAHKIAEFGIVPCGAFNSFADVTHQEYKQFPDSIIYVIYYEARQITVTMWNKKTKISETKVLNPIRGDALGRAKELPLYLKTAYEVPEDKIKLIDGGYKENFALEIWIVPKNSKPPMPRPTLEEKDILFGKGKPRKPRNCARVYDGY